jgi:hypothetical protein
MARTKRRRKARASRPLRGAQHGGDRAPLTVEYRDRLEAVLVVVGVEEPQLPLPMDSVERAVDIEHDAPRYMPEAVAVELDHGPAHTQQGSCPRQVLRARDGRLRAERVTAGQLVQRQLEGRVMAQAAGVVAILVASRDHQHPEAQNGGGIMADPLRQARVVDAGGQALGDAEPLLDLAQQQHAGVGGELPTVEAGDDGLAGGR